MRGTPIPWEASCWDPYSQTLPELDSPSTRTNLAKGNLQRQPPDHFSCSLNTLGWGYVGHPFQQQCAVIPAPLVVPSAPHWQSSGRRVPAPPPAAGEGPAGGRCPSAVATATYRLASPLPPACHGAAALFVWSLVTYPLGSVGSSQGRHRAASRRVSVF